MPGKNVLEAKITCRGVLGVPLRDNAFQEFRAVCDARNNYDLENATGIFQSNPWFWDQTNNVRLTVFWEGSLQFNPGQTGEYCILGHMYKTHLKGNVQHI